MDSTISGLDRHNFHGTVNIVWQIMNAGVSNIVRTRAMAEEFVKNPDRKFRILESGGDVLGMYSYKTDGDMNTITFFGLMPLVRSTRRGYLLYRDMHTHLKGKPTFVVVYENNEDMKKIMKKRSKYLGSFLSKDGEVSSYFMLNFKDTGWQK